MTHLKPLIALTAMVCVFSLISTGQVFASSHESEKTSMEDVQQKMSEFIDTVKNYSADQKDEAVKSVKSAMDQLDQRIDAFQDRLDQEWDEMDQASREKARKTMKTLQYQREQLAEWYGGMKHSSKKAWEEVKQGFVKSYEDLETSFKEAKDQF